MSKATTIKKTATARPYRWSTEMDLKAYDPTVEQMKRMFYFMLLNRAFDDRIAKLYRQGKIIGAAYGSRGQEATSIGSAFALGKDDIVGPIIRNAGAILVRGLPVGNFLSNFIGRATTPTHGKDGNSHLGDLSLGVFAPISHLGSLVINLAGCALAFKMKKEPRVALTYIGDGGSSTGEFHEGLNMAAVWKLPFVLIIENNQWAYSTPTTHQSRNVDLAIKGKAYGVEAIVVDGNDVFEVFRVSRYAIEKARSGRGPILIESKTMRMKGHAEHDDASYVPRTMFETWQKRDPIVLAEAVLKKKKIASLSEVQEMKDRVEREMAEAEAFALDAPFPTPSDAEVGVYAD